jgi:hypothetical protein
MQLTDVPFLTGNIFGSSSMPERLSAVSCFASLMRYTPEAGKSSVWNWLEVKSLTEHSDSFIECCESLVQFAIVVESLKMRLGICVRDLLSRTSSQSRHCCAL